MPAIILLLLILIAPAVVKAGEDSPLTDLLTGAAVCEVSSHLLADLPPGGPLYSLQGGQCAETRPDSLPPVDGYFADAACLQAIRFRSQSFRDYCDQLLDPQRLGNGAYLTGLPQTWTLSQGARMDISVDSIKDNHQPFMTQAVYKSVDSCQLEMRIYKKTLDSKDLKPLIMIHGGSWKLRQSGFIGAEAQVSHFTERGFVVFAPFYRLTGAEDGNSECNGVGGEEVTADIKDALDWVLSEGGAYGAASGRVYVTGQSAGAHLAGWLVTHRADDIARGLLLYPPTDFADFIAQWRASGEPEKTRGLSALEDFIGEPLEGLDLNKAIVSDNSFPAIVANNPIRHAPLFIIHGANDGLVPVRQSERLCNALSATPGNNPVGDISTATAQGHKQTFDCDPRGSQLHIITEADHVLDVCLDLGLFPLSDCPAGGQQSQQAARDSLQAARDWIAQDPAQPAVSTGDGGSGALDDNADTGIMGDSGEKEASGGGASGFLLLLAAALKGWRRRG